MLYIMATLSYVLVEEEGSDIGHMVLLYLPFQVNFTIFWQDVIKSNKS